MAVGTVKWFNTTKASASSCRRMAGRTCSSKTTAVQGAGRAGLDEGQSVSYDVAMERGKAAATNLKLA